MRPQGSRGTRCVCGQFPHLTLLGAASGEQALKLMSAHRPDAVLMDINLPRMDGYAVLQALRGDPATHHIPVIALSADAMPLDVERGLQAGFQAYLTKPVRFDTLMQALDDLIGRGHDLGRKRRKTITRRAGRPQRPVPLPGGS